MFERDRRRIPHSQVDNGILYQVRIPSLDIAKDLTEKAIEAGGVVMPDSDDLAGGFEFGGERIPLINPQRGIFKPRQMASLLSIRTVFPRSGGRVWYDDQREATPRLYAGDDVVEWRAFLAWRRAARTEPGLPGKPGARRCANALYGKSG